MMEIYHVNLKKNDEVIYSDTFPFLYPGPGSVSFFSKLETIIDMNFQSDQADYSVKIRCLCFLHLSLLLENFSWQTRHG